MSLLNDLLKQNKNWAKRIAEEDPNFFQQLSNQQKPEILWIGCSDSRVPATEIIDVLPGTVFVHRNISNLVIHTDLNCLSVIQYAVDVLKVKHIIVCGHYGCGGIAAALENRSHGLIDNWLRHIKDIYRIHEKTLNAVPEGGKRINRLCELNVIEQVNNICHTTLLQHAWEKGQSISVHGWIYDTSDGILRDLDICISDLSEISKFQRLKD